MRLRSWFGIELIEGSCRSDRILMVGCGNSQLSADMFADGYTDLLSTDYSEVVIKAQGLLRCWPSLDSWFDRSREAQRQVNEM